MDRNMVLILGSREELEYAEKLQSFLLEKFRELQVDYDCVLWNSPTIWENGHVTLDSLIETAKELKKNKGFAITLFTPDDVVDMRRVLQYCSRDNVWLEYGLFSGIIGKERVFAVCPTNPVEKNGTKLDWRKPSDFNLYEVQYQYKDSVKESNIKEKASEIAIRIFRSLHKSDSKPNPQKQIVIDGFTRSY